MHLHNYSADGPIAAASTPPRLVGQTIDRMVALPITRTLGAGRDALATPATSTTTMLGPVCLMKLPGSNQTWLLDVPNEE